MATADFTHFVFVDFENVPNVELASIGDRPVMVTLLIGKNQKKLDLDLVQQIHRHAAQVQLIEVGATGHNALDLTLAYYLGCAVEQHPGAHFHIVSKDKDFDPLLAHLAKKSRVSRHDAFAALPFLPQPARKSSPADKKPSAPVDKLEKLIARLQNGSAPRPKRRASLLAHINTAYGNKLIDAEVAALLDDLISRGVLQIDGNDKVSY